MAEPRKRSSRRQTIEPLNYAEAALAPALKGMTSFLDLSPEDVRRGHFSGLVRTADRAKTGRGVDESSPGSVGQSTMQVSSLQNRSDQVPFGTHLALPGDETSLANARTLTSLPSPGEVASPGVETSTETTHRLNASSDSPKSAKPRRTDETRRRSLKVASALLEGHSDYVSSPAPHTIENTASSSSPLVPGRGRSGVRRCLLAQDGHSLGEEAIYQLLWKHGAPESTDPNGSRTVQMGAAEIGLKMNMAKKNVRQNIARLFEKLTIEIVEDFATMTSQARLYRVFSSKQVLQRRRAAGMEYVLRNKGVVFCDWNGTRVMTSPAYVTTPGDETPPRPARPRHKRRRVRTVVLPAYLQVRQAGEADSVPRTDLEVVLNAFESYATVEPGMAEQLIEECRRIRGDARADEIAFLVQEKLSFVRSPRSMANPVGLVLAAVPQAFADASVEEFRRRLARHVTFAADEADWARRETAEFKAWMTREREELIDLASDASVSDEVRSKAEWELRQRDWGA